MKTLEQQLYDFLHYGDKDFTPPEEWPVKLHLELGHNEHEYLAHEIAKWLRRTGLQLRRR